MEEHIEEIQHGNERVVLLEDDLERSNPRHEEGSHTLTVTIMETAGGNSFSGLTDKWAEKYHHDAYGSLDEMITTHLEDWGGWVVTIYGYDHSGITISLTPFACRWDSAAVGFIYMLGSELRDMRTTFDNSAKPWKEQLLSLAEHEIHELDCYITGRVFDAQHQVKDDDGEWVLMDNYGGIYPGLGDTDMDVLREAARDMGLGKWATGEKE